MIRRLLLVFCLLAVVVLPASAGLLYLNETHGATWIQYRYGVNSSDVGVADESLKLVVDGTVVHTIFLQNATSPDFIYLLSDVNANEKHVAVVEHLNISSSTPVLISSKQSSVMSSQANDYFYLVFTISILFIVASLFLKSGLRSSVVLLASVLMNMYLTMSVYTVNTAFSTITTIVAVIAAFLMAYSLYEYAKSILQWESD